MSGCVCACVFVCVLGVLALCLVAGLFRFVCSLGPSAFRLFACVIGCLSVCSICLVSVSVSWFVMFEFVWCAWISCLLACLSGYFFGWLVCLVCEVVKFVQCACLFAWLFGCVLVCCVWFVCLPVCLADCSFACLSVNLFVRLLVC